MSLKLSVTLVLAPGGTCQTSLFGSFLPSSASLSIRSFSNKHNTCFKMAQLDAQHNKTFDEVSDHTSSSRRGGCFAKVKDDASRNEVQTFEMIPNTKLQKKNTQSSNANLEMDNERNKPFGLKRNLCLSQLLRLIFKSLKRSKAKKNDQKEKETIEFLLRLSGWRTLLTFF